MDDEDLRHAWTRTVSSWPGPGLCERRLHELCPSTTCLDENCELLALSGLVRVAIA